MTMSNDVHIKITADKPDGTGIKDVNDDLDDLKKKSKDTIPVIDGLTKSIGSTGKEMTATDRQLASLNDSIAISKDKLEGLARSFADTNDSAQKIDISKAMTKVQSDISAATKAKKIIVDAEPKIPPGALRGLTSDLTSTVKQAVAMWKPLVATGVAAIAPLLGSAIAGGIIGGAGLGGVVGGFMLVQDDPRVIGAFGGLASRVGDRLKNAAQPFVDTTVRGIATVETSLNRINFEGIFKKAATFVQPLSAALGHVAEDLGSGFGSLVQVADPVIQRISKGLADIGGAAKDGMESLTDNADTAADSLGVLLDTVKTTTTVTFGLVNGLTELKAKFDETAGGVFAFDSGLRILNAIFNDNNGTKWVDPVDNFNNAVANGTTTVDAYGQAITSAGASLGELASQTLAASNASLSLFDSVTSVGAAEDKVTETINKHNNSLDATTKKGRANREALSGLVGALNQNYDAYVKVNGAGEAADGVATANYKSFMNTAHAAGIGADAAADYAKKLGLIPPKKDTKINANTHDAAARISALQGQIDRLRGKTVTIRTVITGGSLAGSVHVSGAGGSGTQVKAAGGISGSANGASASGLTWVGEQGPELRSLEPGTRVWSAGDSARMAKQASGDDGPMQVLVKLDPRQDPFVQALLKALRFEINGQGGDVQTVLGT
jgi:hypothetical protein